MAFHSSVAARERRAKEEHPELFCADRRCLWRVVRGDGSANPCRKHPAPAASSTPYTSVQAADELPESDFYGE